MASGGTAALRGAAGQEGSNLLERIRAWLYEGVNTGSQQVSGSLVKVEIGLARGKKLYDKREAAAARDARREMDRTMKSRNRD